MIYPAKKKKKWGRKKIISNLKLINGKLSPVKQYVLYKINNSRALILLAIWLPDLRTTLGKRDHLWDLTSSQFGGQLRGHPSFIHGSIGTVTSKNLEITVARNTWLAVVQCIICFLLPIVGIIVQILMAWRQKLFVGFAFSSTDVYKFQNVPSPLF